MLSYKLVAEASSSIDYSSRFFSKIYYSFLLMKAGPKIMRFIAIILMSLICYNSFAIEIAPTCQNKKITAYTKPKCPYCVKLKNTLLLAKLEFDEFNITNNQIMMGWLISTTKSYTVPYIFIENEYIGGYTDFFKLCIK